VYVCLVLSDSDNQIATYTFHCKLRCCFATAASILSKKESLEYHNHSPNPVTTPPSFRPCAHLFIKSKASCLRCPIVARSNNRVRECSMSIAHVPSPTPLVSQTSTSWYISLTPGKPYWKRVIVISTCAISKFR